MEARVVFILAFRFIWGRKTNDAHHLQSDELKVHESGPPSVYEERKRAEREIESESNID